jgi:hypothetical protein
VYRGTRDWHPQGSAGLSPVLLAGFACGSWRVVPGLPGFQPQAHALVVSLQWPALANPCFNAPIPCSRKELYRETFLLISVLLQFLSLFSLFASPRRYNYCLSDRLLDHNQSIKKHADGTSACFLFIKLPAILSVAVLPDFPVSLIIINNVTITRVGLSQQQLPRSNPLWLK